MRGASSLPYWPRILEGEPPEDAEADTGFLIDRDSGQPYPGGGKRGADPFFPRPPAAAWQDYPP
jgi:hypothetical protein